MLEGPQLSLMAALIIAIYIKKLCLCQCCVHGLKELSIFPWQLACKNASGLLPRLLDVNRFQHQCRILQVLLQVIEGSLSSLQLLYQTS